MEVLHVDETWNGDFVGTVSDHRPVRATFDRLRGSDRPDLRGGVPYIDSAGLGEIVRTYTTVRRHDGSLKLLSLTKRITDLLSITKLLTVFETYDSEGEAVKSFSA